MHFRRFLGMVLRLGMLLALATIACGQVREQPAHIWIETTATGELRGTLTVATANGPAGLPAAFARAVGCDVPDLKKSPFEPRIVVQCPGHHPSALTFHPAIRLDEITPLLRQAGVSGIDFVLTAPRVPWLRLDPVIARSGGSGRHYHVQYSLEQAPQQITIDGGFYIAAETEPHLVPICAY